MSSQRRGKAGRLLFVSRNDLSATPYWDIMLPALARAGWALQVVAPGATRSLVRAHIGYGAETRDLSLSSKRWRSEWEIAAALARARAGRYDAIFVSSQSMSSRALVPLFGASRRPAIIYHTADFYDPQRFPWRSRVEGVLCRRAALCINAEYHRGYIARALYRYTCPTITIPPYLPSAWPIPPRSSEIRARMSAGQRDAFVLMMHSGFSERRMARELLVALSSLPSRYRLVMTGAEHRTREVDGLLADLGLTDRVIRLPRLEFQDLLAYTVNADAGVLLYQNNDLGNFFQSPGRLTEYLACGLPVIATNHTGLENLILKHGIGVAVDSTSQESIGQGIRTLGERAERTSAVRETIRGIFEDAFAFEHWEARLVAACERSITESNRWPGSPPEFPWDAHDARDEAMARTRDAS